MKISKKLLMIILIVTILMPILPLHYVHAETTGLSEAQRIYLEKYIRAYVSEGHAIQPNKVEGVFEYADKAYRWR